jgi:hypothetical protein
MQLKLLLFNLENFFLPDEEAFPSRTGYKPEEKIQAIKDIIEETDPDISMLLEIGGVQSLKSFSQNYLNSAYTPMILPGNSDRGIEMGYLTKKSLPYQFKIFSHKDREIDFNYPHEKNSTSLKFSRDISELRIFDNQNLKCIILLVHLKSKWDREGIDYNGILRREAEVKSLVKLYNEYQNLFPNIPIILSGDMNGIAQLSECEREFKSIYEKTDLKDFFEYSTIPPKERITFYQFIKNGPTNGLQLDYIFVPKSLAQCIDFSKSAIYQFKSKETKMPLQPPKKVFDRYALPSDHYPIILTINFPK